MGMEIILKYFPDLSVEQRERFALLGPLYQEWNERVNLISRKDIEHLYERHILHSLGIAKVIQSGSPGSVTSSGVETKSDVLRGSRFIDVGTGGGFPLVPLAILFPHSTFHGIDGIGKKIMAVKGVIEGLGLTNCTAEQVRSEDHDKRYDVIVSRAVTALPEFIQATKHLVRKGHGRMLYLKGGQLADELRPVRLPLKVHELSTWFKEPFFETKKVVEVSL